MRNIVNTAILSVALAATCFAQAALVSISSKGKQRVPQFEVNKVYLSACNAVQTEFRNSDALHPRITLVLDSNKNGVDFDRNTILLKKWNRDLFVKGVVILAFEDLLTPQLRRIMTNRAVSGADGTTDVREMRR